MSMQPAARTAAILCLSVPLALCLPSTPARADYAAITSEPQAEPAPPADVPFFGEPVIVPEEPPARPKPEKPVRAERQKEPKEPAPSPQQAQKAEKPKPVPQAQAKPQKPRPGRLEIPAEAQKKRDLSFLEGCWYFEDELMKIDNARHDNHGMGREWYCFNKHGKGRFFSQYLKFNKRFSAPATARFGPGGEVVMEHPAFPTLPGYVCMRDIVQCRGKDAGTRCSRYTPDARHLPKRDNIRIVRR